VKLLEEPTDVTRWSGALQTGAAGCGSVAMFVGMVGIFSLGNLSFIGWCLAGVTMLSLAVSVGRLRDREMKMLRELARLQDAQLCAADDAFGYDNVNAAWKARKGAYAEGRFPVARKLP